MAEHHVLAEEGWHVTLYALLTASVSPLLWLTGVEDALRKRGLLSPLCENTLDRANWM